ncbi:hypothetical protein EC973_007308 [Apophysomyces ossiformis]|uniref:Uncharacterized protein n=1 Tax=Apophysomyces ossiformis TaxID=679940 RepID=A0A8H7BS65_9FUNG|nr:hypothetical protein EC973_007308 [Apophysomyces ossiformis]
MGIQQSTSMLFSEWFTLDLNFQVQQNDLERRETGTHSRPKVSGQNVRPFVLNMPGSIVNGVTQSRQNTCLAKPTRFVYENSKFEYSVYLPSVRFVNELQTVFPHLSFMNWGKRVVDRLRSVGMWADITDPASGFPVFSTPGPSPYPDVQATHALTRYDVQNVGCCHILLHPAWKSHIYPTTLFTTAPSDILVKVIDELLEDDL